LSANLCSFTVQLHKVIGVAGNTFLKVLVFQAQGLTVKTEDSWYSLLLLAKEDLNMAVGAAFSQRGCTSR